MTASSSVNKRLHPREHALLVLGYLALALALTWPAATGLGASYYTAGQNIFFFPTTPDAPQNIWNFWWAARAVLAGQTPFVTPLLYYPEGAQMALQTMNTTAVLLALPVSATLGPTAAYNLTAIMAVALTGYAGCLLARAFVPGLAGPALAGALLTAAPFHIAKLDSGQLNFVTMQWLVLFMLAFVRLGRSARRRWPPLAALAFAAVLYTDWYWALVAALFGAVWALLALLRPERTLPAALNRPALLRRYLAFGALAALSALPLAIALRDQIGGVGQGQSDLWAAYTRGYSADALGLLFPAAGQPLWAVRAERFLARVAPLGITEGSYTAAGWVLSALALLGAAWGWRAHWRLLVIGLVAWLLAVGPTLTVLGWDSGVPMPYRLLQSLPLLGTARRPNLFGVVTICCAAILAASAVAELRARLGPRRHALALTGLVALAAFELWPPLRVANVLPRSAVYARIAAAPGVVVDLPLEAGTDSRTLINQLTHGQPILRGYLARPPAYPTMEYSPLVSQLGTLRLWPEDDIVALGPEALATMQCYYRLRYVVLEPALLTSEKLAAAETIVARLGGAQPWYADAQHTAYRLPLYADRCAPFVFLGARWNDLERQGAARWRWSRERSDLYVVNPGSTPARLILTLRVQGREDGQELELWRGDALLAAMGLGRDARAYQVVLTLPPGQSRLELRTAMEREQEGGRGLGALVSGVWVRALPAP